MPIIMALVSATPDKTTAHLLISLFLAAFVAHATNRSYLRSQAITKLVSDEKTQKEAISGGLLRPLHKGTSERVISDRKGLV